MAILLDGIKLSAEWSLPEGVEFSWLGALWNAVWFGSVFI